MEHLVIRIRDPEAGASWQVVDAHGAPQVHGGSGELERAAELAEGRRVLVLVPASEVFRARLDLPARGRRAAVKGARYALEGQIAGDVENLHFAIGPANGEQLEVAAVERGKIADWLDRCTDAGLKPAAVHGEGDALPELPNAAVALLEQDVLLLRDGGGQMVAAGPGELAEIVDILGAEHAGEEAVPFRLVIFCDAARKEQAREAMAPLAGRDVEVRLLEQGVLPQLAAGAMSGRAVNLLQGEFRQRNDQSRWIRDLAIGLLAVAVLYPAYLAMEAWRVDREYQAVASVVNARLRQLMPDVEGSARLRTEFDHRVAAADLSTAANSDDFMRLVQALEAGGSEKTQVLTLNYGNASARLRLRAADMDTLEESQRNLLARGYSVLIQTATPESNGSVLGELTIRDERDR